MKLQTAEKIKPWDSENSKTIYCIWKYGKKVILLIANLFIYFYYVKKYFIGKDYFMYN